MLARASLATLVLFALPVAAQTLPPGWIADAKTHCRVWNAESEPNETISWSGACANGLAEGWGVLQWYRAGKPTGGRYEGECHAGTLDGRGVATFASGNRYDGEWRKGERTGRGLFTWTNGNRFEGEWRDGKRNGRGVYTFANGDHFEGEYSNDHANGLGMYTKADGTIYAGTWTNGCFQRDNRWAVIGVTAQECGFK